MAGHFYDWLLFIFNPFGYVTTTLKMTHVVLIVGVADPPSMYRLFATYPDDVVFVTLESNVDTVKERFVHPELSDIKLAQAYLRQEMFLDENIPQQGVYKNPFTNQSTTPPMKHFRYGTKSLN